jgi:hypothetical protein
MKFICHDAIDCLFKAKTLSADVYIFPKSISEFPASVMRRIGQIFGEKMPAGNTVFFLFSLRTDLGSLERDVNRTRALFNAMLGNGFSSNDDPNSYYHFADEWRGKKIREVDNEFRHPWDTVKFLTEDLHTCCIGYDGEHCEGDCERRLGWWPILTCQQAQWQIFEFRKEV